MLLRGPLGAGKTCFVQGLARGLEVPPERRVTSQTFTLYGVYPGRLPLYHFDAYRIRDPDELVLWGEEALLGGDGVAVVEWGERLGRLLPEPVLRVRIEPRGDQDRRIRIYGSARDFGPILDEFLEEA
jgi:tRNA threonylcarbamoyladenosine biosynthesis protein TsaE